MNKTQTILLMIRILKTRKTLTGPQLAKIMKVSERTIYRYMKELRKAGYQFNTKSGWHGYIELKEPD